MSEETGLLYGLATGIGSMPHLNINSALQLIRENLPFGPHWPQLPQRGKAETFVRQYLNPLIMLEMVETEKGETPFFYDYKDDWLEKMEKFYHLYLECCHNADKGADISFFSFPRDTASGFYKFLDEQWGTLSGKPIFLKGQVSGPLTVGLQVNSGDQSAAFYRDDLRDIINKSIALNARFQVRLLKQHFSLPVVIFIDEPSLLAYGHSSYLSLSREQITGSIEEVIQAVKDEGALCGVHCCSGVDWSILFQLPLDVVSFDAYSYMDSMLVYPKEMNNFLDRGGCLGWGLVPTSDAIDYENEFSLQERFWVGIRRLSRMGVNHDLLVKQFILTPSCGVGTLSLSQSEKVYRTTFQLQKLLWDASN
ncbi:MAG: hypothetical protein Q7J85_00500 [Bacillota bacterium]|nr:hypothetical protein [Bacillota bacterium]